jgi:predicted ferric reductase
VGAVLAALYVIAALSPLIVVAAIRLKSDMTVMHDMGTSLAFAAYAIIALEPVLVSRWKWLQRPFGFGTLARFHKYMGVFACVILLAHPPLMAFGGEGLRLLTGFAEPWYVWLGRVMLSLLILQVVLSLFWRAFGMTYERWRGSHNILAVVIIAGTFVHSFFGGFDMWPIPMRILWLVLLALTVSAYVHLRSSRQRSR